MAFVDIIIGLVIGFIVKHSMNPKTEETGTQTSVPEPETFAQTKPIWTPFRRSYIRNSLENYWSFSPETPPAMQHDSHRNT